MPFIESIDYTPFVAELLGNSLPAQRSVSNRCRGPRPYPRFRDAAAVVIISPCRSINKRRCPREEQEEEEQEEEKP